MYITVQFMSLGILAVIHARLSYDGNVHIWDQRPETAATSSLVSFLCLFNGHMSYKPDRGLRSTLRTTSAYLIPL